MEKNAQEAYEVIPVQTRMFYDPFPLFLTNAVRFQRKPEAIHYRRTSGFLSNEPNVDQQRLIIAKANPR
jgi:hypothetical protein